MKIVVTGSIAFDYLMSFPGKFTEHFLPEHMNRVSLSFLVDTMDKRRGGCAPNIAYTLALLGERPRLMAAAGEDFGEYRQWLEAAGVDTSLVVQIPGKFTASFFCSTDLENNQIASFYTGAMADSGQLSFRTAGELRLAIISPNDPGAMMQYAEECRTLGIAYIFDPGPAVHAHVGRRAQGRHRRRASGHLQRLRVRVDPSEDRIQRGRRARAGEVAGHHARRGRFVRVPFERRARRRRRGPPHRIVDPTGVGDAYRGGLMKGMALRLPYDVVRADGQRGRDLRARTSRRAEPLVHVRRVHPPVRAALRKARRRADLIGPPGIIRLEPDPTGRGRCQKRAAARSGTSPDAASSVVLKPQFIAMKIASVAPTTESAPLMPHAHGIICGAFALSILSPVGIGRPERHTERHQRRRRRSPSARRAQMESPTPRAA